MTVPTDLPATDPARLASSPGPGLCPSRRTALAFGAVAGVGLLGGCSVYDTTASTAAPFEIAPSVEPLQPDTEASEDDLEPDSEPSAEASLDDEEEGSSGGAGGPALASTADIPVGGGRVFADEGVVVTQPEEGTFLAFSSVCTHQGCAVETVEDGKIICPCHDSRFAIADGSVTDGPAGRPLAAKRISVDGDSVRLA